MDETPDPMQQAIRKLSEVKAAEQVAEAVDDEHRAYLERSKSQRVPLLVAQIAATTADPHSSD